MKKIVWILPMVLCAIPLELPLSAAEIVKTEYRLTDLEGQVGVVPLGSQKVSPAFNGMPLAPGDRIVTGDKARAEISSSDGTLLELREKSSLQFKTVAERVTQIYLKLGQLLGKFSPAKETNRSYRVSTPITVVAIRGTELSVCVEENGETQAGVVEGLVAFGRPEVEERETASSEKKPASNETGEEEEMPVSSTSAVKTSTAPAENPEETMVEESKGIIVKPDGKPTKLDRIPPLVVASLSRFPHLRDRIPSLRERWKTFDKPALLKLRQEALRDQVKWTVPEKLLRDNNPRKNIPNLRDQVPSHPH